MIIDFFQNYFYLTGVIFLCIPLWLIIYFSNHKTQRKNMISLGIIFAIFSFVFEFLCNKDYWRPNFLLTYNNFFLPLESIGYGFFFGGSVVGILPAITKKRLIKNRYLKPESPLKYSLIVLVIFFISYILLEHNSIIVLIICPIVVGIVSYIKMRKHVRLSQYFKNGFISLGISILFYKFLLLINPNLFDTFFIRGLPKIFVFGMPIYEHLFHFALGFGTVSVDENVFGNREVKILKKKNS